jgi:hypothetical protein
LLVVFAERYPVDLRGAAGRVVRKRSGDRACQLRRYVPILAISLRILLISVHEAAALAVATFVLKAAAVQFRLPTFPAQLISMDLRTSKRTW